MNALVCGLNRRLGVARRTAGEAALIALTLRSRAAHFAVKTIRLVKLFHEQKVWQFFPAKRWSR